MGKGLVTAGPYRPCGQTPSLASAMANSLRCSMGGRVQVLVEGVSQGVCGVNSSEAGLWSAGGVNPVGHRHAQATYETPRPIVGFEPGRRHIPRNCASQVGINVMPHGWDSGPAPCPRWVGTQATRYREQNPGAGRRGPGRRSLPSPTAV